MCVYEWKERVTYTYICIGCENLKLGKRLYQEIWGYIKNVKFGIYANIKKILISKHYAFSGKSSQFLLNSGNLHHIALGTYIFTFYFVHKFYFGFPMPSLCKDLLQMLQLT